MKKFKTRLLLIIVFLFCFSCGRSAKIDSMADLERKEVLDTMIKNRKEEKKEKEEREKKEGKDFKEKSIPNISKLIVAPPPPPIGNGKLISFSVTEDVPLKDVLIELGRIADIDIEVDPAIDGGIILKVKQKSLETVIERICILGNLRYSYNDNILRFEQDLPYTVDYSVDFLVDDEVWGSIETGIQNILTISDEEDSTINVNKPASIITVYASSKTQNAVEKYIEKSRKNYSAQVLIEAKIMEVTLTDEFSAGINWDLADNQGKFSLEVVGGVTPDSGLKTFFLSRGNLSTTAGALKTFGLTRTLSSPRIHAINNQEAKMEFTDALIYFSVERESETSDSGVVDETYTTTKQEDEEGVTLTITPSINLKTQEITLNVIPELKVRTDWVADPNPDLQEAGIVNNVPLIQTRKMETSLKVKSGGILVIGGLMKEVTTNLDSGVPGLSSIPFLGYLFKRTSRETSNVETVIFIKATIIDSEGGMNKNDRKFYEKFSTDRNSLI